LLDQVLKNFARKNSEFSYYLFKPWIGWEYFENSGIAFGISVPTWFLIIVTPIIIILFLHFFLEENPTTRIAILTLLIPGAISNFIDRVLFGVTIDYLRVFTSLFNLSDILIVGSIFILITYHFKKENNNN